MLPGVFLATPVADDLRWRIEALSRWNPDSVVCGAAAAHLTFWPELPVFEIDVAARTSMRRPGFSFSRRAIPAELVDQDHGLRTTGAALTAVDMIDTHGGDPVDRALRSRKVSLTGLWQALESTAGRGGNVQRRRVLLDSRGEPWSAAERLAHRILRRAGIRGWRANHRVRARGATYFLDIAFPGIRLAIEIAGIFHDRDRSTFEDDRGRQNALVREGWRVLRFTYSMLVDHPEEVVALVRDMMSQCAR